VVHCLLWTLALRCDVGILWCLGIEGKRLVLIDGVQSVMEMMWLLRLVLLGMDALIVTLLLATYLELDKLNALLYFSQSLPVVSTK